MLIQSLEHPAAGRAPPRLCVQRGQAPPYQLACITEEKKLWSLCLGRGVARPQPFSWGLGELAFLLLG